MGKLDGKIGVVTGGARGQGRAHAVALAREGCDVAVWDVAAPGAAPTAPYPLADRSDMATTVQLVEATGRRCLSVVADVRSTGDVTAATAATVEAFGRVDILVANAGICSFAPVAELTDEAWEEMLATDLTGVFKPVRAVLPLMAAQRQGRVIATASMAGRMGMPNLAHYVAAKWGVIGFVKSVALEVAELGITANVVCPATVDTAMVHNPPMYGLFCPGLPDPGRADVEPVYRRMNPMRVPWLDTADVAAAVAFLASDEARFVSGATLEVSMGGSAHLH
ncbi:MAG TPA: mycofactocin-coupled SDR family oxidoreductase [Acidimicrobiales bacterium]|nr:mycofactocin-coupled SDR family oxidoreductase [Acidimicrobiales bacterium]